MNLVISSTAKDPDDNLVHYTLIAETTTFKATIDFYGYPDFFDEFAESLSKFPFENKREVTFEADGIRMNVKLVDGAGHIEFEVAVYDDTENESATLRDRVEAEALAQLAKKLSEIDFAKATELSWTS